MRHSVRARLLQTLACTCCALALPATAIAAGGSGVHVDPSSPVAKEYALPLATARGAQPESGKSGKLFGSGISQSRHTATRTATTPKRPPATEQTPSTVTSRVPPSVTTTVTPAVTAVTPATTTTVPVQHRRLHRRPPHVTTVMLPPLTTATTTRTLTASATTAAYRVLRPGSGSGLLWMLLAAIVVVALGSAGGLVLRHRR